MQPAAGVKGISGEITGDFRQGFEPRSSGFGAESKPGSAGCRSQRAQLSPLLCAAGNSPLASAREQCTASCLPRGRRETRRTRVPRAGTRGRVLGDRGGGGSTDRQAARGSDPPPPLLRCACHVSLPHPPYAWRGKRSAVQHPKPWLLLQQTQFGPLQQAQALCKTLGTEASEEESKPLCNGEGLTSNPQHLHSVI